MYNDSNKKVIAIEMGCKKTYGKAKKMSTMWILMLKIILFLSLVNNSISECIVSPFNHLIANDDFLSNSGGGKRFENKVINCTNENVSDINKKYFTGTDKSNIAYKQIIMKHIVNDGRPLNENYLNVTNEQQTESLSFTDSNMTDGQLKSIFHKKNFDRLKYMDISGNRIQSLDMTIFQNVRHLRELNMARNSIHQLNGNVFQGLQDLRKLDLSSNRIVDLSKSPDIFNNLLQLTVLDLSNNSINDIPRHIFYALGNLIQLNMANNKLFVLPYQAFESIKSVEIIDLSNNLLVSFLDNFFIHNAKLKVLHLQNNRLHGINKNSLYGLKELHTLDLSNNKIIHIDRNSFDTLDDLKFLNLSSNGIEELSPIVFLQLKQLRTIDLSHNSLFNLPLGIFTNQYQLNEIIMDNTRIQKLSNWISRGNTNATVSKEILKNLQHISLRNSTNLRSVESCFFYNLPNIERLYITNSQVTFLPKGISEMNKLVDLDVSNNRLEFIPNGIQHLVNLKHLNLLNNDLLCDCHMFWMLSWINELELKNKTLPTDLLRLSELKCRNGYPGDIIRVLRHINCVRPFLISATPDQQYQVFADAILECSFAGTPAPEIIWRTPKGLILRHNENNEVDTSAKFQLDQHHRSVLKDTIESAKYQQMFESNSENDSINMKLWQGPGITLLENGFLKVHNISRTDSGLYTCFAVNIMGNATKDVR